MDISRLFNGKQSVDDISRQVLEWANVHYTSERLNAIIAAVVRSSPNLSPEEIANRACSIMDAVAQEIHKRWRR
jgi:hypothetical protein